MSFMARRLLVLILALAPAAVFGAGTATMESGGAVLKISWLDEATARIDPQNEPGYMLVRDGKLYAVSQRGGRTMVMDMTAMAGMVQTRGNQPTVTGADNAQGVASVEATGRSETVAGMQGEVYRIEWQDAQGRTKSDEAVLSDDSRALEMTEAFHAFVRAMGHVSGKRNQGVIGETLIGRKLGILRFGDQMRVTGVSSDAPPASAFELPAEPVDLSNMRRR